MHIFEKMQFIDFSVAFYIIFNVAAFSNFFIVLLYFDDEKNELKTIHKHT